MHAVVDFTDRSAGDDRAVVGAEVDTAREGLQLNGYSGRKVNHVQRIDVAITVKLRHWQLCGIDLVYDFRLNLGVSDQTRRNTTVTN